MRSIFQSHPSLCSAAVRRIGSNVNLRPCCRTLSSSSTPNNNQEVFDRNLKQRQRNFTLNSQYDATYYDYLREESARRLVDRLDDITKSFPSAVELGSYRGTIYEMIAQSKMDTLSGDNPHIRGSIGGIETLVQCDMVPLDIAKAAPTLHKYTEILPYHRIVCDEEFLPFAENSIDLVISNMNMHWINDIPQVLANVHSILRPDGAFVCSMLGGNTLKELRHCFYLAELERRGGMSPHSSPLTLPSDVAGLMQAAQFALPTIDVDTIQVTLYLVMKFKKFFAVFPSRLFHRLLILMLSH